MVKGKRSVGFSVLCVIMALAVLSCVGLAAKPKTINLKVGHVAATTDERHDSLVKFAELVEGKTDGRIKVTIYPNSSLGSEREMFEQIQAGVLEVALVGSIVQNFVEEFTCMGLPFFRNSFEHMEKVVMGPVGEEWREELREKFSVELLALFRRNPRILVNSKKPVTKMEDLAGMKVRVPELPMSMKAWRAFGVQPTPMPTSEFYMALRLGVIDAMENPVEVMYNFNIDEVAKYISKTEHERNSYVFICSDKFMKSLSRADQKAVREAVAETQQYYEGLMEDLADFCYAELEKKGMIISEVDRSGFIEASKAVHDDYKALVGEKTFNKMVELGK